MLLSALQRNYLWWRQWRFNERDTSQIRNTGLSLLLSKTGPLSSQLLQPNTTQPSTCPVVHVCLHVHTCILCLCPCFRVCMCSWIVWIILSTEDWSCNKEKLNFSVCICSVKVHQSVPKLSRPVVFMRWASVVTYTGVHQSTSEFCPGKMLGVAQTGLLDELLPSPTHSMCKTL